MAYLTERIDRQRLEQLTDHQVAMRVVAGETALFELIMRRYNRRLFRIARGILGNDTDAEDAVQDAYTRAYLRLGQFRGPDGFSGWICQIVTNEALARRRGRGRPGPATVSTAGLDGDDGMAGATATTPGPAEALHGRQLAQLLEEAIDALPEPFRDTFVLREVEQLSVADTARYLGIEAPTVKSRVHRARRLLQKQLRGALRTVMSGVFSFGGTDCDRLVDGVFARISALRGVARGPAAVSSTRHREDRPQQGK